MRAYETNVGRNTKFLGECDLKRSLTVNILQLEDYGRTLSGFLPWCERPSKSSCAPTIGKFS